MILKKVMKYYQKKIKERHFIIEEFESIFVLFWKVTQKIDVLPLHACPTRALTANLPERARLYYHLVRVHVA